MGIHIVNKFLNLLPISCKNLCDVTFKLMILNPTTIQAFDKVFEELKENLKRLKVHDISCTDISPMDEDILKNVSLCQKLEVLEIHDSKIISNSTLTKFSKLPNLKRLILKRLGPQTTELGQFFQKVKLDNLEYLCIERSQSLTDNAVQNLAIKMPTNLKDIWFYECPYMKLQESTLKRLKSCPKLENVRMEWSNLNGISTNFLREFNNQINLFVSYNGSWIDLEKKLMIDYHQEVIDHQQEVIDHHRVKVSKIIEENGFRIYE